VLLERKRRTREHIIADLSRNHLERFVLHAGHVVERMVEDYGYDLALFTHDADGEPEDAFLLIQLKATDAPRWRQNGEALAWVMDCRDLRRWQAEMLPVILIAYDAPRDTAYWLYMQSYLRDVSVPRDQSTKTIYIPHENVVNATAVEEIRQIKAAFLRRAAGVISHDV
jgi:hypothetical protein